MTTLKLNAIPEALTWINEPVSSKTIAGESLNITAGPVSDWFHNPAADTEQRDAPVAVFAPPDTSFLLSAKVTVDFRSKFDAGVLLVYRDENHWAKLCFEFTPDHEPMIVSVVTRGRSDDCNSVIMESNTVYQRVYRHDDTLVFHYSTDGQTWHFVRHFTIGDLSDVKVGFAAQSPTGQGCHVEFSEISYRAGDLTDIRNGE